MRANSLTTTKYMTLVTGPTCHCGVTGYGNPDYGVVIVGIAPGQTEVAKGKPFLGSAGKLLDATLLTAGWNRDKVYCTNCLCYWNNKPDDEELSLCQSRLIAEIQSVHPKLIIPMGEIPTDHLLNIGGVERFSGVPKNKRPKGVRGAVLWSPVFNCHILPTYHPAAVLRGGHGLITHILRDLRKIKDVLESGRHEDVIFTIVENDAQAQVVLDNLPKDTYVALDIETTNPEIDEIDVHDDKLLCLAISDGKSTWSMRADTINFGALSWPQDVLWTFHNGMFDTQGLLKYSGVSLPIREDTLLQSYTLCEERGFHGLKSLSREYCGAGYYEIGINRKHLTDINASTSGTLNKEVEWLKLQSYNAKDAAYTARLASIQVPRQTDDSVRGFYEKILLPAANVFKEVQLAGVYIDQVAMRDLSLEWFPRYLSMDAELKEEAHKLGWPHAGDSQLALNPNSPKQLSAFLYDILGLEARDLVYHKPTTSTAADIIENLDHPWVDRLLEFRKLDKIIGTYMLGIQDDVKKDGRVHASVLLHGSSTGRPSYRKPPLQTLPREYSAGNDLGRIRRIFGVESEDLCLLEADLKSAEMWMAYAYSKDEALGDGLRSGDPHGGTAGRVFNEDMAALRVAAQAGNADAQKNYEYLRYRGKKINFGVLYGEEAKGLSHPKTGMGCSEAEARVFLAKFWEIYPGFKAWTDETKRRVLKEGEIVSISGRKRRFPLVLDPKPLRQGINAPIQATAVDHNLLSLIQLHKELKDPAYKGSRILVEVHDSIVLEVHRSVLSSVARLVVQVMSEPKWEGFPRMGVDLKTGPNWWDTAKYTLS